MKKEYFDQLTDSLNQAAAYRNGDRKAARSQVRVTDVPSFDAAAVARIRRSMNLTQKGLANVMGVSKRTVEAWEAGANTPSGAASRLLSLLEKDKGVLRLMEG